MNEAVPSGGTILHMGGAARTALVHESEDKCHRLLFAPRGVPVMTLCYLDLCPAFGITAAPGDDGYNLLCAAANEIHPALLRLPRVAAVLRDGTGRSIPGLTDDPRLQLHVLSRCAGSVFLRDLPPAIVSARVNRPVTLLIPNSWSFNQ